MGVHHGAGRRVGRLTGVDGAGLEAQPSGPSLIDRSAPTGSRADPTASHPDRDGRRRGRAPPARLQPPTTVSTGSPLPIIGNGGAMTSLTGWSSTAGSAKACSSRSRSLTAPTTSARRRRLGLDHRHLGHPVLVQDRDRGAHRLVGVRRARGRAGRAPFAARTLADRLTAGPQEAVVGHPVVVVHLREVAPARVGEDHHDDRRRGRGPARPRGPPTPPYRRSRRPGCPPPG